MGVPELGFGLVTVVVFVWGASQIALDALRAGRELARLSRRLRALNYRKQDWTPREHPDVWR